MVEMVQGCGPVTGRGESEAGQSECTGALEKVRLRGWWWG